jgi:hypothetical protein
MKNNHNKIKCKMSLVFVRIHEAEISLGNSRSSTKTNSQPGTFLQRLRPWGPRIDNNDVPSDIQVAFRYARIHDIPLLIGTTTADGADLVFKTYHHPLNSLAFSIRKKIQ